MITILVRVEIVHRFCGKAYPHRLDEITVTIYMQYFRRVVQFCSVMFYVNRHSALISCPKQNKCGIDQSFCCSFELGEGSLRPRSAFRFRPFQLFLFFLKQTGGLVFGTRCTCTMPRRLNKCTNLLSTVVDL